MSVQPPSNGWKILGAIFGIVAGLILVAIGGTCSVLFGGEMLHASGDGAGSGIAIMLISLSTLGLGCVTIYRAISNLRR